MSNKRPEVGLKSYEFVEGLFIGVNEIPQVGGREGVTCVERSWGF